MIVTAMLNWYDEPVELLRECVASAAVIADQLVAADGAFSLVEDARPSSPLEQRHAIGDEARKHRLRVYYPSPQVYEGQVAKRDATLQMALATKPQWLMVIDADWRIHGERDAIRSELEDLHRNGYEQIAVNFITPDDPSRGWEDKAANEWHVRMAGNYEQLAFIYRAQPSMHYFKNHWSLYGIREDGSKVGLFGAYNMEAATGSGTPAKTGFLQAEHLFEHRCLFRERKQMLRNREYIRERDALAESMGFET